MNKNINMMCPIGGTGYGITSLNILKALHQQNHSITLFNIGNNLSCNSEDEKPILQEAMARNKFFDNDAPILKIWHQNDLALRPGKGRYYVYPFFELDTLSDLEKHHLKCADEIFVASRWGQEILINNGIDKKITVAPLGVDLNIFQKPFKIRMQNPNYVFMHIGKWEKRKSQDFLIKCFETAFDINDNVELWLMPFNPFLTKEQEAVWLNMVHSSKLASKIKIFNRVDTQFQLADFIMNADCGVFLSRAEGWNNEITEVMALNKPIIATNYSAHTEYLTEKNSYRVEITEKEKAFDDKWFNGEGNWAKLGDAQLDQTVDYMKYVYTNNIKTNPEGLETAKKYSWTNTANIISNQIFSRIIKNANTKNKKRRR